MLACDGKKSAVRDNLKIPFIGAKYQDTFLMGDFIDETDFNNEAHLFFTKKGSVESFPLPGKIRRWIINTKSLMKNLPQNLFQQEIYKRTGIDISKSSMIGQSPFGVQHYLIKNYFYNNILFCGDSSHVMSPIGGQGMNTGFGDADFAINFIIQILKENNNLQKILFKKYEKYRKKAASSATNRAWLSMRIGTLKGFLFSLKRNILIYIILRILKRIIPPYFSMLTIPYSSFNKILKKDKSLLKKS